MFYSDVAEVTSLLGCDPMLLGK